MDQDFSIDAYLLDFGGNEICEMSAVRFVWLWKVETETETENVIILLILF